MRRHVNVLAAIVLAAGLAGVTVPAAAASSHGDAAFEQGYVLGGVHAEGTWPQDPGVLVDEEAAAGAVACAPGAGPYLAPLSATVGGACADVGIFGGAEQVEVIATLGYDTAPPTSADLAAGYDVDGDGCVGCSDADLLWQGTASIEVPVVEDAGALAVFVYGVSTDTDFAEPPLQTKFALFGTVQVDALDGSHPCSPSPPEDADCGGVEDVRPHLCVPACTV